MTEWDRMPSGHQEQRRIGRVRSRFHTCFLCLLIILPALRLCAADLPGQDASTKTRPMAVKVAAIQCPSQLGEVAANRTKLSDLVRKAASEGAKIIVLPEASVTGYLSQDLRTNWHISGRPIEPVYKGKDPAPYAEEVDGASCKHFAALAKELGVYITVPFVEAARPSTTAGEASPPAYYNTICLVSPEGRVVAHYRKLTPWPYPEKSWATPGDRGVQTFDTEYGRVGLAICFDIHTILEKYAPHKIWALLYCIAWVDDVNPADWFWHRLPARVAPFKHYVIGANWSVDQKQPWAGYGYSEILSPSGEILAGSRRLYGSDIVHATIPTAWASTR